MPFSGFKLPARLTYNVALVEKSHDVSMSVVMGEVDKEPQDSAFVLMECRAVSDNELGGTLYYGWAKTFVSNKILLPLINKEHYNGG